MQFNGWEKAAATGLILMCLSLTVFIGVVCWGIITGRITS